MLCFRTFLCNSHVLHFFSQMTVRYLCKVQEKKKNGRAAMELLDEITDLFGFDSTRTFLDVSVNHALFFPFSCATK